MGRRRLSAGQPRLLGRHHGAQGASFRRAWTALTSEFGRPADRSLFALEMGRVALAWVQVEASARALTDARTARERGQGRRPSAREIERLSRRAGLADGTYQQALAHLREIAPARPPGQSLADHLAQSYGPREGRTS